MCARTSFAYLPCLFGAWLSFTFDTSTAALATALWVFSSSPFTTRRECSSCAIGGPHERYPTILCLEWQRFIRLDAFLGVGSVMINFLLFQGWFRCVSFVATGSAKLFPRKEESKVK